jgi:hypothetical protein
MMKVVFFHKNQLGIGVGWRKLAEIGQKRDFEHCENRTLKVNFLCQKSSEFKKKNFILGSRNHGEKYGEKLKKKITKTKELL